MADVEYLLKAAVTVVVSTMIVGSQCTLDLPLFDGSMLRGVTSSPIGCFGRQSSGRSWDLRHSSSGRAVPFGTTQKEGLLQVVSRESVRA
jgi:hypothetical protein